MVRTTLYILLCFALSLLALSVWFIAAPQSQQRTQAYSENAAEFMTRDLGEQAVENIVHAIAINPYDMALWSQLSYVAPAYREAVIELSSGLSRGPMFNRLRASQRLDQSDLGDVVEGEK